MEKINLRPLRPKSKQFSEIHRLGFALKTPLWCFDHENKGQRVCSSQSRYEINFTLAGIGLVDIQLGGGRGLPKCLYSTQALQ